MRKLFQNKWMIPILLLVGILAAGGALLLWDPPTNETQAVKKEGFTPWSKTRKTRPPRETRHLVGRVNQFRGLAVAEFKSVKRLLSLGSPIFQDDKITTGLRARLIIQMRDNAIIALGEKSDYFIRDYAYSSKNRTGRGLTELTRGVLRFISGKLAKLKGHPFQVVTPIATLGVRGTEGYTFLAGGEGHRTRVSEVITLEAELLFKLRKSAVSQDDSSDDSGTSGGGGASGGDGASGGGGSSDTRETVSISEYFRLIANENQGILSEKLATLEQLITAYENTLVINLSDEDKSKIAAKLAELLEERDLIEKTDETSEQIENYSEILQKVIDEAEKILEEEALDDIEEQLKLALQVLTLQEEIETLEAIEEPTEEESTRLLELTNTVKEMELTLETDISQLISENLTEDQIDEAIERVMGTLDDLTNEISVLMDEGNTVDEAIDILSDRIQVEIETEATTQLDVDDLEEAIVADLEAREDVDDLWEQFDIDATPDPETDADQADDEDLEEIDETQERDRRDDDDDQGEADEELIEEELEPVDEELDDIYIDSLLNPLPDEEDIEELVDDYLDDLIISNTGGGFTTTNNAPEITNQSFEIDENSATGTTLSPQVVAEDPDDDTLTFSLTANDVFAIDANTGELSVIDGSALDYETNPSFALTVEVADDGSPSESDQAQLTINLNNVNEAPSISSAGSQTMLEDAEGGLVISGIALSDPDVGDGELLVSLSVSQGELTLSTTSGLSFSSAKTDSAISFTAALADANSALDGLIYQPEENYFGSDTLNIDISDQGYSGSGEALTASDQVAITITAVNDAPTISGLSNQATPESTPSSAIAFNVDDIETDPSELTLSASSSDTSLVPVGNIIFGGSGTDRTVTITPTSGVEGTATITITVSDGEESSSGSFVFTIGGDNNWPTISTIINQAISVNTSTDAIAFTVSDVETAADDLVVTANSNNTTLVPDDNIVLAGSGEDRTVTLTPAADQTGNAVITITVSDGVASSSETFTLSVTQPDNTAPTISTIANQQTDESTATGAIAFTISDAETDADDLTLEITTNNAALVPSDNVVLGGSGENRTITLTPVDGQSGNVTIIIIVSDGELSASESFVLTVGEANAPPEISDIPNQSIPENTATSAISFTVSDLETAASDLTVSGSSDNTTLVPESNISFGGSGENRSVTITPANNQTGSATITITVSDGESSASDSFTLTVGGDNTAPTISTIDDQTTPQNTATDAIAFTIDDAETDPSALTLQVLSGNTTLLPSANISLGGSGENRTITLTPATDEVGTATVTLTVSDGEASVSESFTLTVYSGDNAPPTISDVNDLTIDEDSATSAIPFTVDDAETQSSELIVTAASSNTALLPDDNITLGGNGASRTVTMTPAGDENGITTVTLTVSDGVYDISTSFTLTVTAINDLPTLSDIPDQTIEEDTATDAISFTVADVESDADTLTLSAATDNAGLVPVENIVFDGSGTDRTVTVTPLADATGTATITVTISDGEMTSTDTFTVTVTGINDPPIISDIPNVTTEEDTPSEAIPFTVSDAETDADDLLISASSADATLVPNANITLAGNGESRTITLTPLADQTGNVEITLTVDDGFESASTTFTLTVTPTNDAPTITEIDDQVIYEESATDPLAFTIGDTESEPEHLVVSGASDDTTLIPLENIVFTGSGADWEVTVTPAADQEGSATITIYVTDGTDTVEESFLVTVTGINDPPVISDILNLSIDEDTVSDAIPFSVSDIETDAASLTVTATSDNATLLPDLNIALGGSDENRTLTLTPVADENGTATITVTVDDGTDQSSDTFLFTVNSINDIPTISDIADQSTDEETPTSALAFTISDVETQSGLLTLSAASDDLVLVPVDNIVFGGNGSNRTVTITPMPDQTGTVTITVTVSDGEDTISDSFVLTVGDVNDAPTISDIGNVTTEEDTATGDILFTIDDNETAASSLTVTAVSNNQTLLPDGNITLGGTDGSRTINVLPDGDQTGIVTVTVTVSDGSLTASDDFTVTVTAVDDPPTISDIADQTVDEDTAAGPLAFTIDDVESDVTTLTLYGNSSDTSLVQQANIVFTGIGANREVTVTPASDQSGTVTITITVSDGNSTATDTFELTVTAVNDVPIISEIPNQSTDQDTVTDDIGFNVDDVETDADSLVVTATSDNQTVAPDANLVLGGSGSSRTITITPASGEVGTAIITVTVDDGTDQTSTTFTLEVGTDNVLPTINDIADQTTVEDTPVTDIAITVGDEETPVDDLTLSAVSSDTTIVPTDNIVFGGSGADRTMTITPADDQNGQILITVTVSDGTSTASDSFLFTITSENDLPTITVPLDTTTTEDTATSALAFTIDDVETATSQLLVTASSDNQIVVPDANLVLGGSDGNRTITITPASNQSGVANITITVDDGTDTTSGTFMLTVTPFNDVPTISDVSDMTINEDEATGTIAITISDVESATSDLTLTASSDDTTLVPDTSFDLGGSDGNRTLVITPALDESGSATITLTVSDGVDSATDTFVLTVNGLNDAPVMSGIIDRITNEDTSTGIITLTLDDVDNDEGDITVSAVSSNTALVNPDGIVIGSAVASKTMSFTLEITPIADQSGSTTITLTASDGIDSSTDSFVLTVNPVNDAPTISDISNKNTVEDVATGDIAVTVGDIETDADDLTLTAISDNATLVPYTSFTFGGSGADRTIDILPASSQSGTATITVTVSDGSTSTSTTFTLTVTGTNDPPTMSDITDQSTVEDVAVSVNFTVDDQDTALADLILTGVSDDQTVLPDSNITFSGSDNSRVLTLTPAADESGTANVTITVSDGESWVSDTFTLTVDPVNDAPTISTLLDQTIDEDTSTNAIGFTVDDVDSDVSTLTLTGLSGDATLVTSGGIVFGGADADRTVTLTPEADQYGSTTITVTVSDGDASSSDSFTLTVNPVIDPPTISDIADFTTDEDTATGPISFTTTNDPITTLTFSGTSSNAALVLDANITFGGTGDNQTVDITPEADQVGITTITVTADDGTYTVSDSFVLTVVNVNDAPTITAIADQVTDEDTVISGIAFTVDDLESDATDLITTAVSDNQTLVLDANVVISGADANRTLTITPEADLTGTTNITVTVSDTELTASETFMLTVSDINDAPTAVELSATSIDEKWDDYNPLTLAEDVGTLTAVDPDVADTHTFAVTGGADSASFQVDAFSNVLQFVVGETLDFETQFSYEVEVTATDSGSLTVSDTFTITLNDVNEPPTDIDLDNLILYENRADSLVGTLTATDPDDWEIFTWALVDDMGGRFTLVDDELHVVDTPAPVHGTFDITIEVTDNGGLTYEETFTITVYGFDADNIGSDVANLLSISRQTYADIMLALTNTSPPGSVTVLEEDIAALIIGKADQQISDMGGGDTITSITDVVEEFTLDIYPDRITANAKIAAIDDIYGEFTSQWTLGDSSTVNTIIYVFGALTEYVDTTYAAGLEFSIVPTIDNTNQAVSFDLDQSYVTVTVEDADLLPHMTFTLSEMIGYYNSARAYFYEDDLAFFEGGGAQPPFYFLVEALGDENAVIQDEMDKALARGESPVIGDSLEVPTSQWFDYYFPGLISSVTIDDGYVRLYR
ncbi:MAG: tandem-95 repeat protein [Magnetococcales bacterium]|nr:tandem-95 repeat protein [Magnetococcales bacterium]